MTTLPEIHVNPKTIPVLESLGVNSRWLMENSAVTQRAYAEMMAERGGMIITSPSPELIAAAEACGLYCFGHPPISLHEQGNDNMDTLANVLAALYDSEINVHISSFWDGGFEIKLGDGMNGFDAEATVEFPTEIEPWLKAAAIKAYPDSRFAAVALA